MHSIAVIDYGMGNLRSVVKALEHVAGKKQKVELTSDPALVMQADRVVFPGQGAAGDCMRAIDEYELRETIIEAADNRIARAARCADGVGRDAGRRAVRLVACGFVAGH